MTAMPPFLLIEPEDLLNMPDGENYELINGIPTEKAMSVDSEIIAFDLGTVLNLFVKQHDLGRAFGSNTGYVCFPNRPRQLRKPDVSFIAKERLPQDYRPKATITVAPDFVVEVISPNDVYGEVEAKLTDYHSAKVKLIWIICPESKTVLIRRLDDSAQVVRESGTLTGEDVIPGFEVKVADLFI